MPFGPEIERERARIHVEQPPSRRGSARTDRRASAPRSDEDVHDRADLRLAERRATPHSSGGLRGEQVEREGCLPLLFGDRREVPSANRARTARVVDEDVGMRPPRAPTAFSRRSPWTPSTVLTSPAMKVAPAGVPSPRERPVTTTFAPASRRRCAIAAPMPRVPPVTSARRPMSSLEKSSLLDMRSSFRR